MAAFGEDFDLQQFKAAYDTTEDMDAYNRVQAVERAVGRVQNYVGELADAGAKLAGLPRPPMESGRSQAQQAFETLRETRASSARAYAASWCKRRTRGRESSTAMSGRRRAMSIVPRRLYGIPHVTS